MSAFLYWTGFTFWIAIMAAFVWTTSQFSREPGKWMIIQLVGFGIGLVRHDGNEVMVKRLLACGYRIRRVRGWWVGFWFTWRWIA